jgi:hypothetical protein
LLALEAAGVDCWEGYHDVIMNLKEEDLPWVAVQKRS